MHASWCQTKQLPRPPPPPRERQQQVSGRKWSYESVLRFSQISSLPVSGSWSALYHRHLMSRADTSVWGKAPQETSVTRRWMEMHQQWINTPNNFPSSLPPSLQQMLQLGSVLSPMLQCGSTFVYLSPRSRTCLEWMRKLDVHAWSCVDVCVGERPSSKRLPKTPSCTRWGCVTPL